MINAEICKERILSEDYRDFIVDDLRTAFLSRINLENLCLQEADFDYRCVYLSAAQVGTITLEKYLYNSIPKCYAPLTMDALEEAGILSIQNYPTLQLKGDGILIGFLDSGINYTSPVFRNFDGSTRIAGIWDQTIHSGLPPETFVYGTEYTEDQINLALRNENPLSVVPSQDTDGHGTFAASLAAGSEIPEEDFIGAAPQAKIAMVKLKPPKQYLRDYYFIPNETVCYQETDILLGLRYLTDLARRLELPLVLCITLGTNAGGLTNALPLTNLLDKYADTSNIIPVIGVGNEADKRHHFYGQITSPSETQSVEIRAGENVSGFTMELWTFIPNILSISLTSPSGENTERIPIRSSGSTDFQFIFEGTRVTIEYRLFVKRTNFELIFFRFENPSPGIWKLNIEPSQILDGQYNIWLPLTEFLSGEVYFLNSSPHYTITNPGNAPRPLVVSYYDGNTDAIALSSGRGYIINMQSFPTITAPGINVMGLTANNRYSTRSGSSISTAIAAGAAALLLEWLIYQTGTALIDTYQIKGFLSLGALRPEGMNFPNREWGYGQLNLYNTFEEIRQF
ncbi:MAG: S8 family peptidase [Schaedlerella sp.]|nr:S8 family peptidase [Schaedlerella sp.]